MATAEDISKEQEYYMFLQNERMIRANDSRAENLSRLHGERNMDQHQRGMEMEAEEGNIAKRLIGARDAYERQAANTELREFHKENPKAYGGFLVRSGAENYIKITNHIEQSGDDPYMQINFASKNYITGEDLLTRTGIRYKEITREEPHFKMFIEIVDADGTKRTRSVKAVKIEGQEREDGIDGYYIDIPIGAWPYIAGTVSFDKKAAEMKGGEGASGVEPELWKRMHDDRKPRSDMSNPFGKGHYADPHAWRLLARLNSAGISSHLASEIQVGGYPRDTNSRFRQYFFGKVDDTPMSPAQRVMSQFLQDRGKGGKYGVAASVMDVNGLFDGVFIQLSPEVAEVCAELDFGKYLCMPIAIAMWNGLRIESPILCERVHTICNYFCEWVDFHYPSEASNEDIVLNAPVEIWRLWIESMGYGVVIILQNGRMDTTWSDWRKLGEDKQIALCYDRGCAHIRYVPYDKIKGVRTLMEHRVGNKRCGGGLASSYVLDANGTLTLIPEEGAPEVIMQGIDDSGEFIMQILGSLSSGGVNITLYTQHHFTFIAKYLGLKVAKMSGDSTIQLNVGEVCCSVGKGDVELALERRMHQSTFGLEIIRATEQPISETMTKQFLAFGLACNVGLLSDYRPEPDAVLDCIDIQKSYLWSARLIFQTGLVTVNGVEQFVLLDKPRFINKQLDLVRDMHKKLMAPLRCAINFQRSLRSHNLSPNLIVVTPPLVLPFNIFQYIPIYSHSAGIKVVRAQRAWKLMR